eukprot:6658775-Pyramimonas_sp.AAC.1
MPCTDASDRHIESERLGRDTFSRAGFLSHSRAEVVRGGVCASSDSCYEFFVPFFHSIGEVGGRDPGRAGAPS